MVGRFLGLPTHDKTLVMTAAFHVLSVRVALWLLPYRVVRKWLTQRKAIHSNNLGCAQIAWAVSTVSRYVPGATCLTQALAAEWMLRCHGYNPYFHIGVTKNQSRALEAHAWIEVEGKVILGDTGLERFTPLRAPGGDL